MAKKTALVLMLAALFAVKAVYAQEEAPQEMPPPEVAVLEVYPQSVVLTENLPARLEASREALVRARINGIVKARLFAEGAQVRAGQTLYQIDDAPYQANLQTAKAQLQQAQANLTLAQSTVNRYAPLVSERAISRQQYDEAKAQVLVAKANINAANAAITQAQINVDYAKVSAPISGYIGRSLVTEGALVSAAGATELARIQQLDPMRVNISQSAANAMRLRMAINDGSLQGSDGKIAVSITFEDGAPYPHIGTLLFTEQVVDQATGDLLVRAEVPNPQGILLPGLYVRAELPVGRFENAFLVPQQAVTRSSDGDILFVVFDDGSYAPKPVTIVGSQDNDWIVTSGLSAGDKVLVQGQMQLMMGAAKVTPVPWTPQGEQSAATNDTPPQ